MKTPIKNITVLVVCSLLAYYGSWLDNRKVLAFRIPHYFYLTIIALGCIWANIRAFSRIEKPLLRYSLRCLLIIIFFLITYAIAFSAAAMYVFSKMDF